MGVLTISLFSSAGSMNSTFALKLAEAAIDKGHTVNLWLAGNAAGLAARNQKEYKRYMHYESKIVKLIEKGLSVAVCEMCARCRGLKEGDLIENTKFVLMDWFLERAASSDRVLNIGGE